MNTPKFRQQTIARGLAVLSLASLIIYTAQSAATAAPSKAVMKATTRSFYQEVFNKHNLAAADKYIAPNAIDHNPMPGQKPGRAGVKGMFAMLFKAFPDMHMTVEDIMVDGDKVVARLTMTGTQKGEFMGMPPSGKRFSIGGVDIIRIKNGKMVEHWGFEDDLGMMQQLKGGSGGPGM